MNASAETQVFQAQGNWFTLKPGQIKNFNETIADFMSQERRYLGLVLLPEAFEDPTANYAATPEGKEILSKLKAQGVEARCNYLRQIVYNNQVSLRMDLEKANIKADPRAFASEGEVKAMEELVKYQQQDEDATQKKVEHIQALEKKLKGK
jgi:hypothetical protein